MADVSSQAGINSYSRPPINQANTSYLEVMEGGVAVGDIDSDGWEDFFLPNLGLSDSSSAVRTLSSALFRNLGNGKFEDITVKSGLDDIPGYPVGALFFDYNNDGHQDLYVSAYGGGQLFRNDSGSFTNVTEFAGLSLQGYCGELDCFTAAASTADYDRDGHLDLLVVNNVNWNIDDPRYYGQGTLIPIHYSGQPTILFRNNGDGTFSNVSEQSSVTNQDQQGHREDGKGLSAVWSDLNNDGWPDIYIANDMTPNRLYINKKDGTFSEIGIAAHVNESKSSMGVDDGDFNHNGNYDLLTTNLIGQMTSLFQNYGNLRFDYVTYHTGIMPSERVSGWGIVFVDLNLDGLQDIAMGSGALWDPEDELENKNLIFLNSMNNGFKNVTDDVINFSNSALTRGLAVIDFDRSGTPDLIYSNIDGTPSQLIQNLSSGHNWLRVDLEGVQSNRDAIGTKVILNRKDGFQQIQTVKAGNSYTSTSSKSLFLGLKNSEVENMIIQWPSELTDTLTNIESNTILLIKENEGIVQQDAG
ncbi:FG-GAP repeat domain-containing protein [Rhodohalobacter sulfatireducens]|uniref:VCBS repeat-containing protein n=1 Tax=Rhodohalobacter sulfatireducens TaxID=2911366 RepID=A0ABS9KEK5_9BACT|nr:VCBS repeat-containing protein [Rhodohalobacter sulfatireducens]MCG2589293.1 VCBS repeat-containing protein [Rhodohalobacter sulfatireducens]